MPPSCLHKGHASWLQDHGARRNRAFLALVWSKLIMLSQETKAQRGRPGSHSKLVAGQEPSALSYS